MSESEITKVAPKQNDKSRPKWDVFLVAGVGLVLTLFLFSWETKVLQKKIQEQFHRQAQWKVQELKQTLEFSLKDLELLRQFYECSEYVSRDEFQEFAGSILSESETIESLKWIPRLTSRELKRFEYEARAEGLENFHFKQLNNSEQANEDPYHYPIYYMEPYRGYEDQLGLNLGSDQVKMEILEKSQNSSEACIFYHPTRPHQSGAKRLIEVYLPIYIKDTISYTPSGRKKNLFGFVSGNLALKSCSCEGYDVCTHPFLLNIQGLGTGSEKKYLYQTFSDELLGRKLSWAFLDPGTVIYGEEFSFADQSWLIETSPASFYTHSYPTYVPWIILSMGSLITVGLSLYLWDLHQRKARTEHLVHERTEELEVQKKSAQEMALQAERDSHAKSIFIANMSHEIRTPMSSILGFAELMLDTEIPSPQKQYVSLIRESGKALLELINDVLDFSKIEAGKMNVEPVQFSLPELLHSVQALMKPNADKKNLEFRLETQGPIPCQIIADQVRLRQCLIHLVGNAVKFTKTGCVTMRVCLEAANKPMFRIEVEDTGIGIVPELQEHIFEAFLQSDEDAERQHEGIGLGLTLTRKLAEMMGGDVSVKSQPDSGSIFTLRIAVGLSKENQDTFTQETMSDALQKSKKELQESCFYGKVLVAEDSPANRVLIEKLLQKHGLRVKSVSNGQQAIDIATKEAFDLIFMDILMPEVNGLEATQSLRERGLTIPIVALTAAAMKGDDKKCLQAGCDAYLTKPINRSKLIEVLQRYLIPTQTELVSS